MNTIKVLSFSLVLMSYTVLSNNLKPTLFNFNAQQHKQQTTLEERFSDKKSDIIFNGIVVALGATLFLSATHTTVELNNQIDLIACAVGLALTGAGSYFGLRDCYQLKQLHNKCETYKATKAEIPFNS